MKFLFFLSFFILDGNCKPEVVSLKKYLRTLDEKIKFDRKKQLIVAALGLSLVILQVIWICLPKARKSSKLPADSKSNTTYAVNVKETANKNGACPKYPEGCYILNYDEVSNDCFDKVSFDTNNDCFDKAVLPLFCIRTFVKRNLCIQDDGVFSIIASYFCPLAVYEFYFPKDSGKELILDHECQSFKVEPIFNSLGKSRISLADHIILKSDAFYSTEKFFWPHFGELACEALDSIQSKERKEEERKEKIKEITKNFIKSSKKSTDFCFAVCERMMNESGKEAWVAIQHEMSEEMQCLKKVMIKRFLDQYDLKLRLANFEKETKNKESMKSLYESILYFFYGSFCFDKDAFEIKEKREKFAAQHKKKRAEIFCLKMKMYIQEGKFEIYSYESLDEDQFIQYIEKEDYESFDLDALLNSEILDKWFYKFLGITWKDIPKDSPKKESSELLPIHIYENISQLSYFGLLQREIEVFQFLHFLQFEIKFFNYKLIKSFFHIKQCIFLKQKLIHIMPYIYIDESEQCFLKWK